MVGTESKKQEILKAYPFRHACKVFDTNKKISEEDFDFILVTGVEGQEHSPIEGWSAGCRQ